MIKFSKFYSESFYRDTVGVLCSNVVKFGRREIGEIVRYLPDKKKQKIGSQAVATRRCRPKSVMSSPQQ